MDDVQIVHELLLRAARPLTTRDVAQLCKLPSERAQAAIFELATRGAARVQGVGCCRTVTLVRGAVMPRQVGLCRLLGLR
jgi:hypothetical protein